MKTKLLLLIALLSGFVAANFAQASLRAGYAVNDANAVAVVRRTEDETVSGTLQVGKSESAILYFGAESGDYAGYCFKNNSPVGRKILAACKNGRQCEVVGAVDYAVDCKVPGLEADLSAAGRIIRVKSVKMLSRRSGKLR